MREGTIILDSDGSIFKIIEENFPSKDMIRVQFIDETESRILSKMDFTHSVQFRSDAVDFQFAIAHSIHKRLNKLKNI